MRIQKSPCKPQPTWFKKIDCPYSAVICTLEQVRIKKSPGNTKAAWFKKIDCPYSAVILWNKWVSKRVRANHKPFDLRKSTAPTLQLYSGTSENPKERANHKPCTWSIEMLLAFPNTESRRSGEELYTKVPHVIRHC